MNEVNVNIALSVSMVMGTHLAINVKMDTIAIKALKAQGYSLHFKRVQNKDNLSAISLEHIRVCKRDLLKLIYRYI